MRRRAVHVARRSADGALQRLRIAAHQAMAAQDVANGAGGGYAGERQAPQIALTACAAPTADARDVPQEPLDNLRP